MQHTIINTLDSDFKAETVAASLIESGIKDSDKILVIRHKGDRKEVNKDVDEIRSEYSDLDSTEYLYIYTNRDGIYDSLPEGLFHQSGNTAKLKTKEEVIAEMKNQREEESLARRFFRPFEMAIDKMKVRTRLYEEKCDKASEYENLSDILKEQYPVLLWLNPKQALLFIKAIPLIAGISRDFKLIAEMMSMILACPVSVNSGRKSSIQLHSQEQIRLKQWELGPNSVLGKSVYYDNPNIIIQIGPASPKQIKSFEINKPNHHILQELINLTIPFDRNVIIRHKTIESEAKFYLSGKTHKTYLGINTILNH